MIALFRLIAAALGLFALVLQFWLMAQYPSSRDVLTTTIHFFSYFTMLANTLIALCMLLPIIAPHRVALPLSKPSVRTATASYSVVVAITYFLFLRNVGGDHDLELLADWLLHYVSPALFIIDWLAFVPKGQLRWTIVGTTLIAPALYGIWTLVHGALTGWYPYSFFNVTRVGYPKTFAHFAGFICMFIAATLALLVVDRLFASFRPRRQVAQLDAGAPPQTSRQGREGKRS